MRIKEEMIKEREERENEIEIGEVGKRERIMIK